MAGTRQKFNKKEKKTNVQIKGWKKKTKKKKKKNSFIYHWCWHDETTVIISEKRKSTPMTVLMESDGGPDAPVECTS